MACTTLLLSEIFPPLHGGSGRWFYEIYRRLPRDSYLIAAGEHPRQTEFDRSHDLRVVRLPLGMSAWGLRSWTGLRGYLGQFRQLRQLMFAEDVRMIHCGRCLPEGFVAYLLSCWTGTPYFVFVHGEDVTTAATSRELSWMVRRVFGRARCVIANSHSTRRILLDEWHLPESKVRLLHPGVDTKRFVPAPRDPAFRRQIGWDERPVILTVGRLQRRKGHNVMIRALIEIRKRIPNVLYAIIGEGEERDRIEGVIAETQTSENVQLLGGMDDARLIPCYQQCELFVLPNRREGADIEGFGMVLVEAQACGKPVVAGDSGGTVETMQIPETGRIVNCDGPEMLADVVRELLCQRELLLRMGKEARNWVVDQFDWDVLTERAKAIFEDV